MRPRHESSFKRYPISLLLVSIGLAAGLAVAQPGAVPRGKAPAAQTHLRYVAPRPVETVVAKTVQGDLTIKDLQLYNQAGLLTDYRSFSDLRLSALPSEKLKDVARWIALRGAAASEAAKSTDPKLVPFVRGGLESQLNQTIISHVVRTEIQDKATSPTQQEIEAYYEKHKLALKIPFNFSIRLLLLQTYEPYRVKQGDTLESIAQAISGDTKQAENIRADIDAHPLRREAGKAFKALVPGEKLLVPMNQPKKDAVRARLETIMKELGKGKKFEELAKQYSESGLKDELVSPMPSGTRPIPSALIEAAKKTPVGGVSPIFQTKHGYQTIQVVTKHDERTMSLSEVRTNLVRMLKQSQWEGLKDDYLLRLYSNPALKVKFDLIAKGNKLTSDTVVATVNNAQVPWSDLKQIWTDEGQPTDPAAITRKVLYQIQAIQVPLCREWVKGALADPTSQLSQQLKVVEVANTGAAYINKLTIDRATAQVTPEKAKAYYEKTKDNYMGPATVKYTSMEVLFDPRNDPAAKTKAGAQAAVDNLVRAMEQNLKRVKSEEDFLNEAAEVNAPLARMGVPIMGSEKPVPLSGVEAEVKSQLSQLKPGQWSKPFILSDGQHTMVLAVLLQQKTAEGIKPFKEVVDQVNKALFSQLYPEILHKVESEFEAKSGFQFMLKP